MIKIYQKLKDKKQCSNSASKVNLTGTDLVYCVTEVFFKLNLNPIFIWLGQGIFT